MIFKFNPVFNYPLDQTGRLKIHMTKIKNPKGDIQQVASRTLYWKRNPLMNKFGERLRSLRESQKLPLAEASRLVSIPQSRLSELERGIRIPIPEQVERLEKFYKVEPGVLAALMQ